MAKGTAKSNAKANRRRILLFVGITAVISLLHLLILFLAYDSHYPREPIDGESLDDDYNTDDDDNSAKRGREGKNSAQEESKQIAPPGFFSYTNLQGVLFWLIGHQLPSLYMLHNVGVPKYSAVDPTQIVSCVDLRDPKQLGIFAGLAQDVLWLSWGLQLLSLLFLPTAVSYVLYMIIPALFVYQVYSFVSSLRRGLMGPQGGGGRGEDGDDDPANSNANDASRQKRRQEARQKKLNQVGGMRPTQ